MKLYSRKNHRHVERQVHFGIGKSCRTACGLVLFSRHVMVSVFSDNDGAIITDDIDRVTCKRCLSIRKMRLRKLININEKIPGIFDRDTLCGEEWLLNSALKVSKDTIDSQKIELIGENTITLSNKIKVKDRKQLINNFVHRGD